MSENHPRVLRFVLLFLAVLLVFPVCLPGASADDAELLEIIPGPWIYSGYTQTDDTENEEMADFAFLTFEEDGNVSLRCSKPDGTYAFSCEGTWAFELVKDGMDRLTLHFTTTDDPERAGSEYNLECLYDVYTESWVENDTQHTYFLLEQVSCSDVSPFNALYGEDNLALHREEGPNMRVVKCSNYVSLRASRSKTSERLAKVPLGAVVLAFPKAGDENGFIWCVYHDEYGYILAEYLQPIE